MQKRGILLVSVLIASMFLFSFVLAADDNFTSPICSDDDNGMVYDKQGKTIGLDFNNNNTMLSLVDKCFKALRINYLFNSQSNLAFYDYE